MPDFKGLWELHKMALRQGYVEWANRLEYMIKELERTCK